MKTKTNDNSNYPREWSTKKLKEEYLVCYDLIYNPDCKCYGTRDLITLQVIGMELKRRNIHLKVNAYF